MQAGGRRFDPVQLHQTEDRPRGRIGGERVQKQAARQVLFASGFLNQCYRLLFNNAEEVKQILLDGQGRGRKPSSRHVVRDGLDCIDLLFP